eukprot:Nitzschia sp. Nitz4//scaffold189_size62959//34880//35620//NITZ4_006310-RA/size62959-processed-gene-0.39-mRNA-1//-1//CDS//3329539902//5743//frame0
METPLHEPSALDLDPDEQFARDVQLAYDLQAREERKERRRTQYVQDAQANVVGDGFYHGALNADHMLFVSCTIDSRQVEMLVDTGASASAMSMEMVHRLGLSSKFNTSIGGLASGVGSSNILGIVENVNCTIGHVEFRLFFMVLEGSMPYCILGLDQMRRFKCMVDLDEEMLIFGGKDGVRVDFLPQTEAAKVASRMMATMGDVQIPSSTMEPRRSGTSVVGTPVEQQGPPTPRSSGVLGGLFRQR